MNSDYSITDGSVSFYTVPTDSPEADGTFAWKSTSMALVRLECGETQSLGYTYADEATAVAARKLLKEVVIGSDPLRHGETLQLMLRSIRNIGETGIAMMAVSAIDNAIWDLRARLAGLPLVSLLGQVRSGIPVYGSGGFTTYSPTSSFPISLAAGHGDGFANVKMKIGTNPDQDPARVSTARKAIGSKCNLFVDANGAYTVTQAIELAHRFAEQGVRWFEEPVSSDHLVGLNQVRATRSIGDGCRCRRVRLHGLVFPLDARCAGGHCAAGRLHTLRRHQRLSRCGGALLGAQRAALFALRAKHASACLLRRARAVHMEFFHDHARIERMFFDGFCEPVDGCMIPDLSRPGMDWT